MIYEEDNVIDVGKNWIYSMANRRPVQTGLPVNIWIDEAQGYKEGGHWKRIKFQLNHGKRFGNQPNASMDLNGSVVADTYDKTISELSKKEIREISNFVKNNQYALDKVADEDIFMDQFDEVMIKGGKPATKEQIENQKTMVDQFIEWND